MKYDDYCAAVIGRHPTMAATMRRLLAVVREGGPRSMNVLESLAIHINRLLGPKALEKMLATDLLVKIGDRRGSLYGTPYQMRGAKIASVKRIKKAA